jgi:hypothetical protein
MKTVFLRVLESDDKAAALLTAIKEPHVVRGRQRFEVDSRSFGAVPRSPFAYWVSEGLIQKFKEADPVESGNRTAKIGPSTGDDGRYVRCWWEIDPTVNRPEIEWVPFAKGGSYSPYYADVYLVISWGPKKNTFFGFTGRVGRETERPNSLEFFRRPGITWPLRTQVGLALRAMPAGCIFGHKGPTILVIGDDSIELLSLLGVANSSAFRALVDLQMAFGSYEVGVIQRTPIPDLKQENRRFIATLARRAWSLKRGIDQCSETSHAFLLPALLLVDGEDLAERTNSWVKHVRAAHVELANIDREIDACCFDLYRIASNDRHAIDEGFASSAEVSRESDAADAEAQGEDDEEEAESGFDPGSLVADLMSWSVSVAFGRFDLRLATGQRALPEAPEPFDALPVCSPAMLFGDDRLPLRSVTGDYAVSFPENGVLVDDPGHSHDLTASVRKVFEAIFKASADEWWNEVGALLDPKDHNVRKWLVSSYFERHLKRHSKSRRKAPIVWHLAISSGRYGVWLYAPRLTKDSLFQIQNDVVAPKLAHEEQQLTSLVVGAGANPSAKERKEIAEHEVLLDDLRAFLDEVKRVAPLWNPALDDGVVLTMAPLWRLVPQHKPWQRELKSKWDELAAGKYDWSHAAMHLWPERVIPRCVADRSLAIAHGLEDVFWVEADDGKWEPRSNPKRPVDELVRERTSIAVKAALKALTEASVPNGPKTKTRRTSS